MDQSESYRIEAEALDKDAAYMLRDTIEECVGLQLTAFDERKQ